MGIKLILFFGAIILFSSCNQELTKIEKIYDNGEKYVYHIDKDSLKQGTVLKYYANGNINYKAIYSNDKKVDSTIFFYESKANQIEIIAYHKPNNYYYHKDFKPNGIMYQEGLKTNTHEKTGKWKYYDTLNGELDYIKEFKIIKGKRYLNQGWHFAVTGDTINDGSNMRYKPTKANIKLGDSIRLWFQAGVPFISETDSDYKVTIPKDFEKENFDREFTNTDSYDPEKGIPFAIKKSLKHDDTYPIDKAKIDTTLHRETVLFYIKPTKVGKDTIRGWFTEYIDRSNVTFKDTSMYYVNRNIYFDIPIEVSAKPMKRQKKQ
ncbi:toxin-antitoxin system YwqK family antitoxin [Aquimarina algicola]|uniref:Toxin-antitoxin system YwqK family antitoxin n=1 Tax=Aquimarina algicola TaxID=2589995 RepID=A0A504J5N2_9FLAO|nr:hypothetical protein [Aquimarina algicola]TPN82389.1 hypothetical protein FHK87_23500 [Aquimarina algicola]